MMRKRCCVISQESLNEIMVYMETKSSKSLNCKIEKVLEYLVLKNNVKEFICNMDMGITISVADIVLKMKRKYPFLKLRCAIPYETQAEYYPEYIRDNYYNIMEHCDNEVILTRQKRPEARDKSIRYMIDKSDIVIFICEKSYLTKIKKYISNTYDEYDDEKKYVYLNPKTGATVVLLR